MLMKSQGHATAQAVSYQTLTADTRVEFKGKPLGGL